jgi:predicted nuclease of predicted toxin-antitoxin system
MKIVIDMNMSPKWCSVLNSAGHNARHWSEIGAAESEDLEILDWARANEHIILTADLDFAGILAASGDSRPSVVVMRLGRHSPALHGSLVTGAIERFADDLRKGAVLSIDNKSLRARLLPLASGN